MLSVARSRFALLSQFLFLVVNTLGMLFGIIYNNQTPDLYENNAHHKIGWIASCIAAVQVVMSLIFTYAGRGDADHLSPSSSAAERGAFLPVSTTEHPPSPHHHFPSTSLHQYRWSDDSHGTSSGPSSSSPSPSSPSTQPAEFDDDDDDDDEKPGPQPSAARRWMRNTVADRFFASRIPGMVSNRALAILYIVYMIIDRILLPFGFIAIATGGVTFGGIMVSVFLFYKLSFSPPDSIVSAESKCSMVWRISSRAESSFCMAC